MSIDQLEHINYFGYHTPDEKKEFKNAIKLYSSNRKGLNKIINKFTFPHDKRSFLIEESIDHDTLMIDGNGRDDKWVEFALSAESVNKTEFIELLRTLGLTILFGETIEYDEKNELKILTVTINDLVHTIEYPYLEDELLLYRFAEVINQELKKINSPESVYMIERFPTILLVATEKIYQYLTELDAEDHFELLKPEEWIEKYKSSTIE